MIKHKLIITDGRQHYICNKACTITQDKAKSEWKDVTCKNCLIIQKGIHLHRPMKLREHIHFHIKRMIRKDTLMFLIFLVPLVLIGAYLDARIIGAMTFKEYMLTCAWEYAIIMVAFEVGFWKGLRKKQFKFEGE